MARRLGARSGPVATAQVSRPYLACRIACLFGAMRCQAETAVTFVARSLCVGETAITFARSKCVFLRHCGRAKVSLVSCVPVNERAKAVAVSFGREIVRPAALCHRESAKQFALRAHNTPHLAFMCSLGECFAEEPLEGLCWASFSCDRVVIAGAGLILSRRGTVLLHCCPASIVCGNRSQAPQASGRPPDLWRWGFCSIRSWRALYARRVAALMMQLPPSHIGELVV